MTRFDMRLILALLFACSSCFGAVYTKPTSQNGLALNAPKWLSKGVALSPSAVVIEGGSGDPYFSSVKLLLHMNGTDGSTTFTDSSSSAHTVTAFGNAQIDTAQSKYGGASGLFDGSGDYCSVASSADFGMGDSDYTIEGWIYQGNETTTRCIFDNRELGQGIAIYSSVGGGLENKLVVANNADIIGSSTPSFPTNTWSHWAVTRESGTLRGFIDGVEVINVVDSRTYASSTTVYLGANYIASQNISGWVDDYRITKGVARYTANFTPPTAQLPDN